MSNILTNNINPRSGNLITIGGANDRVSIAGTLSYEDVANIDSVGIITAQSGIHVTGGSVGIGTTLPSNTLSLEGSGTGISINSTNDEVKKIIFKNSGTTVGYFGSSASSPARFINASAVELARIDSSGRLLIGSSANTLVARGGVGALVQIASDSNSGALTIRRATDGQYGTYLGFGKARGTLAAPTIVQDDDELGVISWGAYDGTDYASYAASITCSIDGAPGANDVPGQLVFATTADGANTSTDRLRINKSGTSSFKAGQASQARFGTTDGVSFYNAENTVTFYGNANDNYILLRGCNAADGTPVLDSQVGGARFIEIEADGSVNSQGDYTNISDQRLKENIVDSSSQWDDIKALRVRNFNFTEASGYPTVTKIGFIAQEVEQVSPGLVKTRSSYTEDGQEIPDTDTKIVKTSVVTTKAIKALQEAMARIETLEQRLTDAGL